MRNWIKSISMNDITNRAIKTFFQAFLSAWALSNFQLDKGVLVGAGAAAFSALWNYLRAV